MQVADTMDIIKKLYKKTLMNNPEVTGASFKRFRRLGIASLYGIELEQN